MSGLTTHVLDLTRGQPAAQIAVSLSRQSGGETQALVETLTDQDGRARMLAPSDLTGGAYRLEFGVGAYFRALGAGRDEPAFLEIVVIEFNLPDSPGAHHVPLLVSPFGYSTYRGS